MENTSVLVEEAVNAAVIKVKGLADLVMPLEQYQSYGIDFKFNGKTSPLGYHFGLNKHIVAKICKEYKVAESKVYFIDLAQIRVPSDFTLLKPSS